MMQTSERLLPIVRTFVSPQMADSLTASSRLLENAFLDSLGLIQLVAEIDAQFGIEMRTEDLTVQNFGSIDEIARLVEGYLGAQ